MSKNIVIEDQKEKDLIQELETKTDIKAERIKRLLKLPDLTKKENSPIKIVLDQIVELPIFKDFDLLDIPRVVTVQDDFDVLNTPKDHPSRRETDTYYLDETHILRTQMTVMWPYYLRNEEVLKKLKIEGHIEAMASGIVFRKDEIDRKHFPAFHQIDFLYICRKEQKIITVKDLENVQAESIKAIFGDKIEYRFLEDSFPFTDPSIQVEIKFNDQWMEVTGAGLVHTQCLKNFGLDSEVYNGWAFSFGIDRLAMLKMGINDIRILWSEDPKITSQFKDINSKYKEVSKYPQTTRDISFVIDKDINLNNYYEIVRDFAENLIEEVKLLDSYEDDAKFGKDKKSYTFRIVYRSPEKTLTNEEINKIQDEIREKTKTDLNAILR
jgi:phenylalanyl-tRNA synthetase alpha chain